MKPKSLVFYLCFLLCIGCISKKDNFIVYNQDAGPIDTLFIFLDDRKFIIEDLKPNRTKSIYIPKMYETEIFVQAGDSLPMKLPGKIKYPEKKIVRIIITKSRIVVYGTFPYTN